MSSVIVRNYKIDFTFDEMADELRLKGDKLILYMRNMYEQALENAIPKAAYRICYIDEIADDRLTLDGVGFQSEILAHKLEGIHRVFAYIVTCGAEVEEITQKETDNIMRVWLDMMKGKILASCRKQFETEIKQKYGMKEVATMSPGAGNMDTWPLEQQRDLFGFFGDSKEVVGVELTDTFLMLPTKSVSGVLFPSDKSFVTCSLCERENCVGRRAPYEPESMVM